VVRRHRRGPYQRHGMGCPFCADGQLRRRGVELSQPNGIMLSLRRCTNPECHALVWVTVVERVAAPGDFPLERAITAVTVVEEVK
jgi:hypothetical protein